MSNIEEYTFGYDPASKDGDYSTVLVMKGDTIVDHLVSVKQLENTRKQTIEECRGCVPKKSQFNKLFDYDDCREEYLLALNDLE